MAVCISPIEARFDEYMHECLSRNRNPKGYPIMDSLGYSDLDCMEEIGFCQFMKIRIMAEDRALPFTRCFLLT